MADTQPPAFLDRDTSLYDVLGTDRLATEEEIREQYQLLSKMFRSQVEELKTNKQLRENRECARYAYRILSDSITRALYDRFGYDGLQAGLALSTTVEDITKPPRTKAEQKLAVGGDLGGTCTKITVGLDVTSFMRRSRYNGVDLRDTTISYALPYRFSDALRTTATLKGSSVVGKGYLMGIRNTLEYQFSPKTTLELTTEASATKRKAAFMGYRSISTNSVIGAGCRYRQGGGIVGLLNYRTQMTQAWRAETQLQLAPGRGLAGTAFSFGFYRPITRQPGVVAPGVAGQPHSEVVVKFKSPQSSDHYKGLVSLTYPLMRTLDIFLGASYDTLSIGLVRHLKSFQYGFKVNFGLCNQGPLDIHLYAKYHENSVVVPMRILQGPPSAEQVLYSLLWPFLGFCASHEFLLVPATHIADIYRKRQEWNQYLRQREAAREKAGNEVLLMTETVQRLVKRERKGNGLVVLQAWYGDVFHAEVDGAWPNVIEVTVPVQFLVEDSEVEFVLRAPKSKLDGFYDPCFGVEKHLLIYYQFQGLDHIALIGDQECFSLPSIGHTKRTHHLISLLPRSA